MSRSCEIPWYRGLSEKLLLDVVSLQPRLLADLVASFEALREQARQLVSLVGQQGAEIKKLREQVREPRRRLGLSSKNSSKSPSSDDDATRRERAGGRPKSARRPGGQPGHPGRARPLAPPEELDEVREIWPSRCPTCLHPLGHDPGYGSSEAQVGQLVLWKQLEWCGPKVGVQRLTMASMARYVYAWTKRLLVSLLERKHYAFSAPRCV
ncbi:MAG: hypothetical protein HYV63_10390 [Candidatus Schekmanbacteria bacterium]|nr:hypothetical protein [Candidatus Schekmanbacteria bacterium]